MPKSKRNKVVHLTQVKKKGKDHKDDLLKQLKQYLKEYNTVYLFDFDSTKSDRILNLRMKLKGTGRVFAGRNSIVSQALKSVGSKTNTDYEPLIKHIVGHKGLLFTNLSCDELIQLLEDELPEFREKLLGYAEFPKSEANERDGASEGDEDASNDEDDDHDNGEGRAPSCVVDFKLVKSPSKKKQQRRLQKPKRSNAANRNEDADDE